MPSRDLSLLYATWALCYVCGTFHRPLTREGVLPLSLVRMQPESPPSGPRERSQSSPFAKPAVELTSVRLAYRDLLVLRGLDLTIARRGVLLAARPERLRQDDDAQLIGGFIEPDAGDRADPRPARARRRRAPAAGQHGLPELRAVPAYERRGERRLRAAHGGRRRPEIARARQRGARPRFARRDMERGGRTSSPAASSSASRSPARSSTSLPCCFSTSRSAPLT